MSLPKSDYVKTYSCYTNMSNIRTAEESAALWSHQVDVDKEPPPSRVENIQSIA
jgi:hypothetical protein